MRISMSTHDRLKSNSRNLDPLRGFQSLSVKYIATSRWTTNSHEAIHFNINKHADIVRIITIRRPRY
jgi:hypothetical protein